MVHPWAILNLAVLLASCWCGSGPKVNGAWEDLAWTRDLASPALPQPGDKNIRNVSWLFGLPGQRGVVHYMGTVDN